MLTLKFFCLLLLINLSFGDECGKPKVVLDLSNDGEFSQPGQWPWLASLYVEPQGFVCGASIISKKFLLGAAHCVHPKGQARFQTEEFHAMLGRYQLNDTNDLNSMRVTFSEIFLHPDWDPKGESFDGNVALFKMEQAIEFTDFIQPICLPNKDAIIFDVEGTVAGYGLSESSQPHENRPKHVKIKSVANDFCLSKVPLYARKSSLNMSCAGVEGKNPCRGDTGGPFMVNFDGRWTVNGIISSQEYNENDFVIFTKVPKFLEWIKENIEGRGTQLECRRDPRHKNDETRCFTDSLKILEPNLRVTSIALDDDLNFNEIEWIYVYLAEVHYLPDFSLLNQKFPNLKKLYIENSELKELDKSKLELLPRLTEFNAYENEIKELPEDAFNALNNLEVFGISNNQIKVLPQKLLCKLPKLKEFYAYDNQIEAIPARFFEKNKNIEEIWMFNNKISRIEIDLRSLPKLREFDLKGNRCIDERFHVNGLYGALSNTEEFQRLINANCLL